jgi:excinuclease ABC subunit C
VEAGEDFILVTNLVIEQVNRLPLSPGVYIFKDAKGVILYIGKAAILRHRIRSYFSSSAQLSPKLSQLTAEIADIEYYVTGLEQEALILEMNLIKRHRPPFNVRLMDDKSFPYLKVEISQPWPRVYSTRRMEDDGSRYFGPFASAKSVKQTLKVIKSIFPFRFCTKPISGVDSRACLEYHMGRCLAPCTGGISRDEYMRVIKQVILFLEGKQERIVRELQRKMKAAAQALDFEKAARLRDQVESIQSIIEGQRIATKVRGEQDAIAFAQSRDVASVQVFFVRNNKLTGRETFVLQGIRDETPQEIMTSFVKQFYSSSAYVPPVLLLQYPVEDADVIREWLKNKRRGTVQIIIPERGRKKELVNIVAENARQALEQRRIKEMVASQETGAALAEIQETLKLPRLPERIEGYDISDIQGQAAVGSMVVFEKGKPRRADYRRFKIKTVAGADDYVMIQEVLKRRFRRLGSQGSKDETWALVPDLILIDGGKGHLNAALAAMKESGGKSIPLISLAKENEEFFLPGRRKPVILPRTSPGLKLLQRLRDEAHRFAIAYFQKVHKRETFTSFFDNIKGIGPKRRRSLLKKFGSVKRLKEAPVDEIASTKGITAELARRLKEVLGAG